MAEETENTTTPPPPPAAKPRGKSLPLIVIAAAVLLLGGGAAAFFLMKPSNAGDENSHEAAVEDLKTDAEGGHVAAKGHGSTAKKGHGGGHGSSSEAESEAPSSLVLQLEPITANLNEENHRRMVVVKLALEASDEATYAEIEKSVFRLRDSIILVLGSKTQADLQTEAGKELLKREIMFRIDQMLGAGKVVFIGYDQFLLL